MVRFCNGNDLYRCSQKSRIRWVFNLISWIPFVSQSKCFLLKISKVKRRFNGREDINPILGKIIWLGGTARNAVVVVFASLIAYAIEKDNVEYWREGCKPNTENCTSLTLTKVSFDWFAEQILIGRFSDCRCLNAGLQSSCFSIQLQLY